MKNFSNIRKLVLEPGVLFPIANVFTFLQSQDVFAIIIAILNVMLSVTLVFKKFSAFSPLRGTALLVLLSGLFALAGGDVLPGVAGLAFATGNFLASHPENMASLHNRKIHLCRRAACHPAIYYGLGYSMIGLMAGGGMRLLTHPFDNRRALLMVSIGVATIFIAILGRTFDLLEACIPFWILAAGTAINSLAGAVTGNFLGAGSCFFAMLGELRLGWMTHEISKMNRNRP
jgi:hypothetical protein